MFHLGSRERVDFNLAFVIDYIQTNISLVLVVHKIHNSLI